MKYFFVLLTALCLATGATALDFLPFGVTLGGQTAVIVEGDALFAHFAKPVGPGAVLAVKDVTGQVIVNIFASDDKGVVANGVQPAILLFDAAASKSIDDNMTGKKHAAGWYAANIVAGGGTSRILFQLK